MLDEGQKFIAYYFISLPKMREKGSRFGDLRLFDDIHSVSSSGYHLPACTVQTNHRVELAAVGFIASSNNLYWKMFVEDTIGAFASSTGSPLRPWAVTLADGDGCIENATQSASSSNDGAAKSQTATAIRREEVDEGSARPFLLNALNAAYKDCQATALSVRVFQFVIFICFSSHVMVHISTGNA